MFRYVSYGGLRWPQHETRQTRKTGADDDVTVTVVWWLAKDDEAVHAFSRMIVARHETTLTTMCGQVSYSYRVERHDLGPKCLACRALVGPS